MPCEQELLSNYHYKSIHPGTQGVYAHTHMPELFVSCWHGDFIGSKCLVAKQTGNKLQNYYLLLWSVCESEKERRKSNLCIAALYQALSQVPTDSVSLLVVLVFSIFSLENASYTWKTQMPQLWAKWLNGKSIVSRVKIPAGPRSFPMASVSLSVLRNKSTQYTYQ